METSWLFRVLLPLTSVLYVWRTPTELPRDPAITDPVWPRPVAAQYGPGPIAYWRLQPTDLTLILDHDDPNTSLSRDWDGVRNVLVDAQRRYRASITAMAGGRPALDRAPVSIAGDTSHVHVAITSASVTLDLNTAEDYRLEVAAETGVRIASPTVFGAVRALQTLAQLAERVRADSHVYVRCVVVEDAPAYPFRGLMIDTARHYLPVDVIDRILDGMEIDKLNVLHWHVSDDQSFPFRSASNPDLVRAAYTPDLTYSPDDVRGIARRALMRGIRIVAEFDTPGHSASFGVGYPAVLAQCPNVAPTGFYMINPVKDETRRLVSSLLKEAADVFGASDLVHLGGDEVDTDCLESSDEVRDYMQQHGITDPKQLLADYQAWLEDVAARTLNRTAIVWQEVYESDLPMSPNTIVDVWYDAPRLAEVVQSGRRAVLSSCWYLDHLGTDWRSMYDCDPGQYGGGGDEDSGGGAILGGHACMWGEKVDQFNAISRIWPRASTMAERLWTRRDLINNAVLRARAEDRLDLHRCRLVRAGIGASPIRPGYCPP